MFKLLFAFDEFYLKFFHTIVTNSFLYCATNEGFFVLFFRKLSYREPRERRRYGKSDRNGRRNQNGLGHERN